MWWANRLSGRFKFMVLAVLGFFVSVVANLIRRSDCRNYPIYITC